MKNNELNVAIKYAKPGDFKYIPGQAYEWDTGYDLRAAKPGMILPGEIENIPTGIILDIPSGVDCQIRSRSSMAKKGIVIVGGLATIDPGYQGELYATLINLSRKVYKFHIGDRIAQLVFLESLEVRFDEHMKFKETQRGNKGWGSSGA